MRAVLLAAVLLAGCASTPKFSDSLGATYLAVDAVAKTAIELCAAPVPTSEGGECAGSISTEVMRGLHASVGEALDTLDAARAAYQAGSADIAEDRLQTAQALVRSLEAYLVRVGHE